MVIVITDVSMDTPSILYKDYTFHIDDADNNNNNNKNTIVPTIISFCCI